MTERASDLLNELADRLSADSRDSSQVVAESVRRLEPELLKMQQDGTSIIELVRTSEGFLEILFRSLHTDSDVPWLQYYARARETSRRYADRGIPLDSVLEGLAVFRRSVLARVTEEVSGTEQADEVLQLAQSRLGGVVENFKSSFIRGYLDSTDVQLGARQNELRGLYEIASELGRSLEVAEIAEVGLQETLKVLKLQAGALWTREGARLLPAKTLGLLPGEEKEFESGLAGARVSVLGRGSGQAVSRVDRITGEWSAIRAELRTKTSLVGAMIVATRLPRAFPQSDLDFVGVVADQIAISLDRARQHTKEARTDYLTGLANRPEFERAIDRAVADAQRHKRRIALMMIDLDNLKEINDSHGHHVGDEAIRVLAHELQRAVRATDTCGRLGGDEFGVAMPEADERHANEVGARVRASLEELRRLDQVPVPVEFSIGVAAWRPGMEWQEIYELADKSLYVDKRRRHAHRKKISERRVQGASS